MTVSICHRATPPGELARFCKSSALIVAAAGQSRRLKLKVSSAFFNDKSLLIFNWEKVITVED
jgi:5,10-methylene-tetrahydrofolate dehydrogenase/methenyl tetrahydrofolate cyclohydrolase